MYHAANDNDQILIGNVLFCMQQVHREAILLWRLRNPNILRCYGLIVTSSSNDEQTASSATASSSKSVSSNNSSSSINSRVARELSNHNFLVLERCDMDLAKLLHEETVQLTLVDKLHIAHGIACGMRYLHWDCSALAPVIHNDLKPHNVLINLGRDGKPKQVKVADFGVSCTCQLSSTLYVRTTGQYKGFGSLLWLAPEACEVMLSNKKGLKRPMTREVDVYAFGVLLFELITQEAPYGDVNGLMLPYQVFNGLRPDAEDWLRQQQQFHEAGEAEGAVAFSIGELKVVKQLVELMQVCWAAAPDARPSFKEISARLERMELECLAKE